MASTSGISVPAFQPPAYNEASNVSARIESQVGSIRDIFAEVQSILGEMQALRAPVKGGQESDASFQARVSEFQNKLNGLNHRLENTYRKLGQAQAVLNRLQTQEMPAAERRDAEHMQKSMKDALAALEEGAKAIQQATKAEKPAGVEELRIEVRLQQRNVEIKLASDPSFRSVIQAFALMAMVVGDPTSVARRANPAVRMPFTPGSGIPGPGVP